MRTSTTLLLLSALTTSTLASAPEGWPAIEGCKYLPTTAASGNYVVFYVPETGEICDAPDCGGGRAPPKSTVPGCHFYTGTETAWAYTASYVGGTPWVNGPQTAEATATPSSVVGDEPVESAATTAAAEEEEEEVKTTKAPVKEEESKTSTDTGVMSVQTGTEVESSTVAGGESTLTTSVKPVETGAAAGNATVGGGNGTTSGEPAADPDSAAAGLLPSVVGGAVGVFAVLAAMAI